MINKAVLAGRLTRDPEIKSTANGISVVPFTVAITRRFKNARGERESDFINCVAFRHTAEFLGVHFKKGDALSVVGSIQTRTWDDSEGKKRYATEVIADEVGFISGNGTDRNNQNTDTEQAQEFSATDDDLPF